MQKAIRSGGYCGSGTAVVRGLPAKYYTDSAVFEEEKRKIFYRSWVCLGHICMAPEPGSYFVGNIVDQEILVVRGDDNKLRAFYNVCQHRGHQLAEGEGKCRNFICPYHAWKYDLSGALRGAPHANGVVQFEKSSVRLKDVRLEVFLGMIFVNLDPDAQSVRSSYGFIEEEVLKLKPNIENQKLVYDYPLEHKCNWKASVENFSECYHCGPVHKYLVANVVDPKSYQLTTNERTQRHSMSALNKTQNQDIWFLWPNTAFGLYPIPGFGETFCIRTMYAVKCDLSIYHYRWFVDAGRDPSVVIEYAKHHAQTTGAEDESVAAGVQRGMKSNGFNEAILLANPKSSHSSEHAIIQFHRWVLDALDRSGVGDNVQPTPGVGTFRTHGSSKVEVEQ